MNDKVELRQEFRPLHLVTVKKFDCQKVFEVFVVCNDINRCHRVLEVVVSDSECFMDSE